jgi:hypothetical protein
MGASAKRSRFPMKRRFALSDPPSQVDPGLVPALRRDSAPVRYGGELR